MQEHIFEDRIYYRTNEFKPERLTLVFAHGAGGSSSAWLPYEKIFENKYNILSYDIRGHGKSKKYLNYEDYEIKKFAFDLHDLVNYLKIHKFILISNSFAGLVAFEYIKMWRSDVIGNVFTSPEVFLHEGLFAKIVRPMVSLLSRLFTILPFDPKPRGQVDYSKHIGSSDWDIKRNLADIRNTTPRVQFYAIQQSLNPKQEYCLEKIDVPTLVIHGELDSMVPMKNSIRLSKEIKNSEFVCVKNVDHNTVHNGVKFMSAAIESFIEKNKNVLK
ncbi:alpha/beta hydrolase [Candidatus Nomurabacteria bacterium]|nr:alpha/beta hydrolase [Candidatus Nomurabacteria bacterium]